MKKLTIAILALLILSSVVPVSAQPPWPPSEGTTIAVAVAHSCENAVWEADPDTYGPLTANSAVAAISVAFCDKNNTTYISVGSVWEGYGSMSQRVWGSINIKDASGVTATGTPLPFDEMNVPARNGALVIPLTWPGPRDGRWYYFTAEINVRAQDGSGPNTVYAQWSFLMGLNRLYLPTVFRRPPSCNGYQVKVETLNLAETIPFATPGVSTAQHEFGKGWVVNFSWVDYRGNLLNEPPQDALVRLSWDELYTDPPLTSSFSLQATNWMEEGGPPPWLAKEHTLTFQFPDGNGQYCRVTIPMIWDPPLWHIMELWQELFK